MYRSQDARAHLVLIMVQSKGRGCRELPNWKTPVSQQPESPPRAEEDFSIEQGIEHKQGEKQGYPPNQDWPGKMWTMAGKFGHIQRASSYRLQILIFIRRLSESF